MRILSATNSHLLFETHTYVSVFTYETEGAELDL